MSFSCGGHALFEFLNVGPPTARCSISPRFAADALGDVGTRFPAPAAMPRRFSPGPTCRIYSRCRLGGNDAGFDQLFEVTTAQEYPTANFDVNNPALKNPGANR